jgi:hypothetical protein
VRILRVLSLHNGPLSRAGIAQRTGLGRAGANRAIERLEQSGILESVGDPPRTLLTLSADHPLSDPVGNLFRKEAARTDHFFAQVRDAAGAVTPSPTAVWLIGSAARREDVAQSDIDIAVVFALAGRPGLKLFNSRVHEAGAAAGLRASVVGMSLDELAAHAERNDAWWQNLVADAVPLVGQAPVALMHD